MKTFRCTYIYFIYIKLEHQVSSDPTLVVISAMNHAKVLACNYCHDSLERLTFIALLVLATASNNTFGFLYNHCHAFHRQVPLPCMLENSLLLFEQCVSLESLTPCILYSKASCFLYKRMCYVSWKIHDFVN